MALKILNRAWPYGLIIMIVILFSIFSFKSADEDPIEINYNDYSIPKDLYIDLEKEIIDKKADIIDSLFSRLHKRAGFNGTVLFAEKGRMVYKGAFGYSDYRRKTNLTTDSRFQLASVSKMFTATAILILYEKDLLDLDDKVVQYIQNFPYDDITIRNLLNHRSGLPRYMSLAHDNWKDKTQPMTNQDVIDLFVKHKPKRYYKPDKVFHYCNTNYVILASIVESISNSSFDRYISMNIFHPLRMQNSFVYNHKHDTIVPDYVPLGVSGYDGSWRLRKVRDTYLNGVMGDKGVYSTVEDLFRFDQALYEGKLVHDTTLQKAFSPGTPKRRYKDNYGFGWRIKADEDSCVYHYGWWKGFRSFFIRDLKQSKSIMVLSNRSKGPGSYTLWEILHDTSNMLGLKCNLEDVAYAN